MKKDRKVLDGEGLLHFFEMHGRWGDTVYRRKRNGVTEEYPYLYNPPTGDSPLKMRTSVLNSYANSVSNPQYQGYDSILHKLYYYTPYFITPGNYKLQGQTIFYIRQSGFYTLERAGDTTISWQQKLCRRTMVRLNFNAPGEYEVRIYMVQDGLPAGENEEYCRRLFVVLEEGADVKAAYDAYLNEYLGQILQLPEPDFERIKTYKRGLVAKTNIILGVSGTYKKQIFYQRKNSSITFLRANYDHAANAQSQSFKLQKALAIAAWNAESAEFKQKWARAFYSWYAKNYRRLNRMITPYMWYVSNYVNDENE
jgi:hypothetical protein